MEAHIEQLRAESWIGRKGPPTLGFKVFLLRGPKLKQNEARS
jgi:hypothetical protein